MKTIFTAAIMAAALVPAVPALADSPSPQDYSVSGSRHPGDRYTETYRSSPAGIRFNFRQVRSTDRTVPSAVQRDRYAPWRAPRLNVTGPSATDLEVQ